MRNNKNNINLNVGNITLNLENIIPFYRNITSHFTDKQKILTLRFKNITLSLLILILSLVNITLCFSNYNNTSALDYSSNVGIGFTFNPILSINISPSDLIIDNLTPGTNNDSNVINVSVATNASHGYTLSATVGDSLHNNNDLVHTNNTNAFSSITTDSSLPSLTTDNTWGYSYRLSNNNSSNSNTGNSSNTWSNYSGLSSEISKTLVNTDSQIAKPIDFKIGAKASNAQPSGTYTNTINFIAISKPIPKTIEDIAYMQTFGELLPTDLQSVKDSMIQEHTYTLKDARDEQDYTIAKLKDGKIWMTKNLNLAGGTGITSELSDVPANYTLPTENGFQEGNRLPESSQTGFGGNTMAYVYNTGNNTDNCASPGCYSYYSWVAATAGSEVNVTTSPYALYSICPKSWELPTRAIYNSLIAEYNEFYNQAGPGTAPNFLLAGLVNGNNRFINGNKDGWYWTSAKRGGTSVLNYLYFNTTSVNTSNGAYSYQGLAVRCLAR